MNDIRIIKKEARNYYLPNGLIQKRKQSNKAVSKNFTSSNISIGSTPTYDLKSEIIKKIESHQKNSTYSLIRYGGEKKAGKEHRGMIVNSTSCSQNISDTVNNEQIKKKLARLGLSTYKGYFMTRNPSTESVRISEQRSKSAKNKVNSSNGTIQGKITLTGGSKLVKQITKYDEIQFSFQRKKVPDLQESINRLCQPKRQTQVSLKIDESFHNSERKIVNSPISCQPLDFFNNKKKTYDEENRVPKLNYNELTRKGKSPIIKKDIQYFSEFQNRKHRKRNIVPYLPKQKLSDNNPNGNASSSSPKNKYPKYLTENEISPIESDNQNYENMIPQRNNSQRTNSQSIRSRKVRFSLKPSHSNRKQSVDQIAYYNKNGSPNSNRNDNNVLHDHQSNQNNHPSILKIPERLLQDQIDGKIALKTNKLKFKPKKRPEKQEFSYDSIKRINSRPISRSRYHPDHQVPHQNIDKEDEFDFRKNFMPTREISEIGRSEVIEVIEKSSGKTYAVKIINKRDDGFRERIGSVEEGIKIFSFINHTKICRLHEVHEDLNKVSDW